MVSFSGSSRRARGAPEDRPEMPDFLKYGQGRT
jgi:hypothetical protein